MRKATFRLNLPNPPISVLNRVSNAQNIRRNIVVDSKYRGPSIGTITSLIVGGHIGLSANNWFENNIDHLSAAFCLPAVHLPSHVYVIGGSFLSYMATVAYKNYEKHMEKKQKGFDTWIKRVRDNFFCPREEVRRIRLRYITVSIGRTIIEDKCVPCTLIIDTEVCDFSEKRNQDNLYSMVCKFCDEPNRQYAIYSKDNKILAVMFQRKPLSDELSINEIEDIFKAAFTNFQFYITPDKINSESGGFFVVTQCSITH